MADNVDYYFEDSDLGVTEVSSEEVEAMRRGEWAGRIPLFDGSVSQQECRDCDCNAEAWKEVPSVEELIEGSRATAPSDGSQRCGSASVAPCCQVRHSRILDVGKADVPPPPDKPKRK